MRARITIFFGFLCLFASFSTTSLADNQCRLAAAERYRQELASCGTGVPSEAWTCRTEVTDRDGAVGQGNCPSTGPKNYACYIERTETCTDSVSGRTRSRNWRDYTGACVGSFSDCW